MATKNSKALWVNAFSVFNIDRYDGDADMVARFTGLTEADLNVSNIDIDSVTGVVTLEVKSPTRAFSGTDQSYIRANMMNPKILNFTPRTLDGVTTQAEFLEAIKFIDQAGVYQVTVPALSGPGLLVIHPPIDDATPPEDVVSATHAAIDGVLDTALIYGFESSKTVAADGDTVTFADSYLTGAVYHAPVGAAMVTIPATDYGALDDAQYDPTI